MSNRGCHVTRCIIWIFLRFTVQNFFHGRTSAFTVHTFSFTEVLHIHIKNPVQHLRWNILQKSVTAFKNVNLFCKTLRLRCLIGFWIKYHKLCWFGGHVGGVKEWVCGWQGFIEFWRRSKILLRFAKVGVRPNCSLGWRGSNILRKSKWNIVRG